MNVNTIIAAVLFLSALVLTTILVRLRIVRDNALLRMIFILNPGLVGTFAALSFLSKVYFPKWTLACYIASFLCILISMPVIIVAIPRSMFPPKDR